MEANHVQIFLSMKKAGMKRYDRNSDEGLSLQTVNPCNNFIVDFLLRCKIKSEKVVSSRYFMYNLAIESVKKYPLPLITEVQLHNLEGFGDFFETEIGKLIDRHYTRGRLPTQQEMQKEQREHFQAIRQNQKRLGQERKNRKDRESGDYEDDEYEDGDKSYQNDGRSSFRSASALSKASESGVSRWSKTSGAHSSCSTNRKYTPRVNTESYTILQIMLELNAQNQPVTKGDINQMLFNRSADKIKSWFQVKDRLLDHGYIYTDDTDNDLLFLSDKAIKFLSKGARSKDDQQELSLFLNNKRSIQGNKISSRHQQSFAGNTSKCNSRITINKKQFSKKLDKPVQQGSQQQQNSNQEEEQQEVIYEKRKVISGNISSIKIIFSSKIKESTELEQAIEDICPDKIGIVHEHVEVGDFLWYLESRVLDFVVVFVDQDEFDEAQYEFTLSKLKRMKCLNVLAIWQSSSNKIEQGEYEPIKYKTPFSHAICRARVSGIKVMKTKNRLQTAESLLCITQHVALKVEQSKKFRDILYDYGTLKNFNEYYHEMNSYTVQDLTFAILRSIPDMQMGWAKAIIKKIPTLKSLYSNLRKLGTLNLKNRMIMQILKGLNPSQKAIKTLIDLLKLDTYDKQEQSKTSAIAHD